MSSPTRIALLTGCLEPGRDGVGDYTHGLAIEAASAGLAVMMVALADRYVSNPLRGDLGDVPVLRLPAATEWRIREGVVRDELSAFDPDWLSVQFVPYSFHRRGWVGGLAAKLEPLLTRIAGNAVETRSLHLMFHELWLGLYSGAPWKHRLEGIWQRRGIRRFVRALKADVVQTSNPAYRRALQAAGIQGKVLPLFGSIPVAVPEDSVDEGEVWWLEEQQKMGIVAAERQNWWLFGVFGSIHPEWSPRKLLDLLLVRPAAQLRRLALVTIGRSGFAGEKVMDEVEREFAGRIVFRRLGEHTPARVATFFRHLDFGIATSPWTLIGKSSSAVAMREHGLPVIVTRTDRTPEIGSDDSAMGDPLLLRFDSALPGKLTTIRREPPCSRRPNVVRSWLETLDANELAREAHDHTRNAITR